MPSPRKPPPVPLVRQKGRPPSATRRCRVEVRYCRHHGATEFAFYACGSGRRIWRCKRCVGESVTRRKQKVRRILVAEGGGCCAICGYDRCAINLSFHHVVPEQKSFGLAATTTKSLAAYRAEMEKCVLVCANCHGEIETGLMPSPPAGARFEDLVHLGPLEHWEV